MCFFNYVDYYDQNFTANLVMKVNTVTLYLTQLPQIIVPINKSNPGSMCHYLICSACEKAQLHQCGDHRPLSLPLWHNQRHICPLLFLTPRLPGFLIGRRLNSHALELLLLDRALRRLGPHQLSDSELKQVRTLSQ